MARKVDKTIKMCVICGDKAKGINFNVLTCMSCKAFFRRNALRKKDVKCPFNDCCQIDKITRKFCSKCRLKKCFESGMKKEWILSDEEKRLIKEKILRNKELKQQQELKKQNRENSSTFNSNNGSTANRRSSSTLNAASNNGVAGNRRRRNGSIKEINSKNRSNDDQTFDFPEFHPHHHQQQQQQQRQQCFSYSSHEYDNSLDHEQQQSETQFTSWTSGSSKTRSSSSSAFNLFIQPSAYSLDTLLTSDVTDVFLESAPNYPSLIDTINNNHDGDSNESSKQHLPQLISNISTSSTNVFKGKDSFDDTTIYNLKAASTDPDVGFNQHATDPCKTIPSTLNTLNTVNEAIGFEEPPLFTSEAINEVDTRFTSSSISSSLIDCCFLFSNSIDSMDLFNIDLENFEELNNNNDKNGDVIQDISNQDSSTMIFTDDPSCSNHTDSTNVTLTSSEDNGFIHSVSSSSSSTETSSISIDDDVNTTKTSTSNNNYNTRPGLVDEVSPIDDKNNDVRVSDTNNVDNEESVGNNNNGQDFSQYLLHDNDPPLTLPHQQTSTTGKNVHPSSFISPTNDHLITLGNNGVHPFPTDNNNNNNIGDIVTSVTQTKSTSDGFEKWRDRNVPIEQKDGDLLNKFMNEPVNRFDYNIHGLDPTLALMAQPQLYCQIDPFSHQELMLAERCLIQELTQACSILRNPYKRIIYSDNAITHQYDQVRLLKRGLIEMLTLRSVLFYDPDRDALSFLDDKCKISIVVSMDVLKPWCRKYDYRRFRSFPRKFVHEWKTDNIIFDILTAMILFTPVSDLRQNEKIKEENNRYTYLLKRYLEIKYSSMDEAKSVFRKLMFGVEEIRSLNEDIIYMLTNIQTAHPPTSPLYRELFDLDSSSNNNNKEVCSSRNGIYLNDTSNNNNGFVSYNNFIDNCQVNGFQMDSGCWIHHSHAIITNNNKNHDNNYDDNINRNRVDNIGSFPTTTTKTTTRTFIQEQHHCDNKINELMILQKQQQQLQRSSSSS